MCCGGGFGGGGGGGSTGNISGDLTVEKIPYASGAHTLADSPLRRYGADAVMVSGRYMSEDNSGTPWAKQCASAGGVLDINFKASAGTLAAPVAVAEDDFIGGFNWQAYDGVSFGDVAAQVLQVDGPVSPGVIPTSMAFRVHDLAGVPFDPITYRASGAAELRANLEVYKSSRKIYTTLPTTAGLVHVDALVSDFYRVHVDVNIQLKNPTNALEGQVFQIRFKQTAGGGHTISFDTQYRFPDGVEPTLSAADGATDYMAFQYNEEDAMWDFAGGAPNMLVPS